MKTLNEFLGEYCSPFAYEVAANKGRMKTLRSQNIWQKFQDDRAKEYYSMREKLIAEYKRIYGEQPINKVEELIKSANGHEDNECTHAARRVCEKRGINWSLTKC